MMKIRTMLLNRSPKHKDQRRRQTTVQKITQIKRAAQRIRYFSSIMSKKDFDGRSSDDFKFSDEFCIDLWS